MTAASKRHTSVDKFSHTRRACLALSTCFTFGNFLSFNFLCCIRRNYTWYICNKDTPGRVSNLCQHSWISVQVEQWTCILYLSCFAVVLAPVPVLDIAWYVCMILEACHDTMKLYTSISSCTYSTFLLTWWLHRDLQHCDAVSDPNQFLLSIFKKKLQLVWESQWRF